jgi:hypothetical protein
MNKALRINRNHTAVSLFLCLDSDATPVSIANRTPNAERNTFTMIIVIRLLITNRIKTRFKTHLLLKLLCFQIYEVACDEDSYY